ncbi:RecQ family ATP-dependent DNA helicase [Colwellia sp. Arc7-D]|uniref:RecQ family ATP-dependent DNA helicase n=1 Tax=Colwellia sp. Arc7-D TaxID=2161872 RepID=UPI000D3BBD32|nr:RecQ family ATP-dependent DNA helicase [Colwellia sp. Arc7-D]AWB57838.1 RecQ family ATP-dependent DNA helicase [Colwellia sp. Arc7-D]
MKELAKKYLHEMTGNPLAKFHEDQWESINELVNKQNQLLVVQRTGWGKSAVYFIATKIRRSQGFGPTLIISPLLSLIRNQIDSAAKLGLSVVSYNSSMDKYERQSAENKILASEVDAVIIAPEQLGQTYFAENILNRISGNIGLFVVDEAHCISDWGHDFRPDYGRIVRVLQNMPQNMPVLATTATANNRVVNDIKDQLGDRLSIIRGPLTRKSLQLQNIDMSNKSERLAWLAQYLKEITGTGIIYAKTTKDCEIVAGFLQTQGIDAHAYHSQLETSEIKENLEKALIKNKIKALVSTSALGMGFDKPDLSFVIHYQSPGNVVEYYQQVGRAGRGIDSAIGIMMLGKEDGKIQQYFIENAFPKEHQINQLLDVIEKKDGVKLTDLEPFVNFSKGTITSILKFLGIEQPSPILKDDKYYYRTQFDYKIPQDKIDRLNNIKQGEWDILNNYHQSTSCLMQFLSSELDDPETQPCGKCENCNPANKLSDKINHDLVILANDYLRHRYIEIKPRATFASSGANAGLAFKSYGFPYRDKNLKIEKGMALSSWKDGGWGDMVAEGKQQGSFSHDLIPPMVKMINSIPYEQRPSWLTYVPSPRHPNLVRNFAHALAKALGVECKDTISISEVRPPQKTMENSFYQSKNLDGAFGIDASQGYSSPVWLLDDAVDSKWTFTVAGALLRQSGVSKVVPIALTSTSKNN